MPNHINAILTFDSKFLTVIHVCFHPCKFSFMNDFSHNTIILLNKHVHNCIGNWSQWHPFSNTTLYWLIKYLHSTYWLQAICIRELMTASSHPWFHIVAKLLVIFQWLFQPLSSGIILCLHPTNERWRYSVTPILIGWAHTQNDLWSCCIYLRKCKHIFIFSVISQDWGGADSWKPSSWKTRTHLFTSQYYGYWYPGETRHGLSSPRILWFRCETIFWPPYILTPGSMYRTIFWPRGQCIITIFWPPSQYFDPPPNSTKNSFVGYHLWPIGKCGVLLSLYNIHEFWQDKLGVEQVYQNKMRWWLVSCFHLQLVKPFMCW